MVGGGQKLVEDAAVVIEAVAVRKQCPVGGQRVGKSRAGVGDDGQAVEACFHRQHAETLELRRHEQIVERLHVAGESEDRGHELRVERSPRGCYLREGLLYECALRAVAGDGKVVACVACKHLQHLAEDTDALLRLKAAGE